MTRKTRSTAPAVCAGVLAFAASAFAGLRTLPTPIPVRAEIVPTVIPRKADALLLRCSDAEVSQDRASGVD